MSDDFALDFIHSLSQNQSQENNEPSPELKKYLSLLNPEQDEAVKHSGSPLLILAGAGSGKTRVITTKIAYLINQKHINPHQILAVTFTKKAAKEMQERAVAMEAGAVHSVIRTFHSFGAWFLRMYYEEAGLEQGFTVYDDDDMVTLVSKSCPELNRTQASSVAHKISLAKDYCYTPDSPELINISSDADFREAYAKYQKRLRETGNVDFGDLIMLPVLLLEKDERIRSQIQHRFKVIMVDEYQDSNVAQYKLLKVLASPETYVCVVGDDDQSIYKFRGAEVQNILSFQNEFPGTKLIRLERNYRSTAKILFTADKVVSNNESRLGKTLIAERGEGKKPVLVFLPNQDEEAKFCASMILKSHKTGVPFSDWAVLYRTNAQSLTFETEFLHQKIPYSVVGSLKFYEREEIKDMLSFLSLVANPKDEISFRRIVNKPARGLGEVTQNKIFDEARNENGLRNLIDASEQVLPSLSKKAKTGLKEFIDIVRELEQQMENHPSSITDEALKNENTESEKGSEENSTEEKKETPRLSDFVDLIMTKTGLLDYHKAQDEIAGTQRAANMQELVNSAVLYEFSRKGLLDFLDHIELDRTLENAEDESPDSVTLITLHNTKGLEFERVVITGLETGIFPRQNKSEEELEEERRLFYVGITRAKDELYVTSCRQRRLYGRVDFMEPSQFLFEAGDKSFRVLGEKPLSWRYQMESRGEQSEENEENSSGKKGPWAPGTKIYHDDYGYGQIVSSKEEDGERVICVQFENGSTKKFLPEYQKSSLMIVKD